MGHTTSDMMLASAKRSCDDDLQKAITNITSFLNSVQSMNRQYALEIADRQPETVDLGELMSKLQFSSFIPC
jgi:hypothetical protein